MFIVLSLIFFWGGGGSSEDVFLSEVHWHIYWVLVDTFVRLRKTTISFIISVCPSVRSSVRPYGTTQLPLDVFSWYFIFEYFSKTCRECTSFNKIRQK